MARSLLIGIVILCYGSTQTNVWIGSRDSLQMILQKDARNNPMYEKYSCLAMSH